MKDFRVTALSGQAISKSFFAFSKILNELITFPDNSYGLQSGGNFFQDFECMFRSL
jgi:hypothetical protein